MTIWAAHRLGKIEEFELLHTEITHLKLAPKNPSGWNVYIARNKCRDTEEDALKLAVELRDKKIASLEKQIAKLRYNPIRIVRLKGEQ